MPHRKASSIARLNAYDTSAAQPLKIALILTLLALRQLSTSAGLALNLVPLLVSAR